MTVDDVKARLLEISEKSEDDEHAHQLEDGLWEDVLRHIATGGLNATVLAQATLASRTINFARWCA